MLKTKEILKPTSAIVVKDIDAAQRESVCP
jgi:hypothetical protein